ncbi:MAG: DNA-processing protein DprA [Pseudomonadota bacterium]
MDELRDWLALYTIPQCGFATVLKLLTIFSTPAALLSASTRELRHAGATELLVMHLQKPDWQRVEACLSWREKSGRDILHWHDSRYPLLLREIASPPLILFVEGKLSLLQQPQLAIVGARQATATGLETAYDFASELTKQGFVITSGLARGIDGASHKGAINEKEKTIAVLGSGLDKIYPSCHQRLAQQIVEKEGALVSEFFPDVPPKAEHFPRRNRIISGLSLGVIVVEAAQRSGSLITARYAAEQGREVFAIPGSIRNPLSEGCHALLKQGATLVESVQDILFELSFSPLLVKESHLSKGLDRASDRLDLESRLDSEDIKLVECLGFETTTVDSLVMRTGLAADRLLARLAWLELQDYISVVPGGYVRK